MIPILLTLVGWLATTAAMKMKNRSVMDIYKPDKTDGCCSSLPVVVQRSALEKLAGLFVSPAFAALRELRRLRESSAHYDHVSMVQYKKKNHR